MAAYNRKCRTLAQSKWWILEVYNLRSVRFVTSGAHNRDAYCDLQSLMPTYPWPPNALPPENPHIKALKLVHESNKSADPDPHTPPGSDGILFQTQSRTRMP